MKKNLRTKVRKYFFYKDKMENEIVLVGIAESPVSAMPLYGSWFYHKELQVVCMRDKKGIAYQTYKVHEL